MLAVVEVVTVVEVVAVLEVDTLADVVSGVNKVGVVEVKQMLSRYMV